MKRIILASLFLLIMASSATAKPLSHSGWLGKTTITEYYPAPERWFTGRLVDTPGMQSKHRIDWLYSARGIVMEGDGTDLHGNHIHLNNGGSCNWLDKTGKKIKLDKHGFSRPPYWRGAYWKNAHGKLTYPLLLGGWSNGKGIKYIDNCGMTFAAGSSLSLTYYRSVAVDPKLIPLGSYVYLPAYRDLGYNGWFKAQDTGGAIRGRHVDVYRSAPKLMSDSGRYMTGQEMYVVPPGHRVPKVPPHVHSHR